MLRHCTVFQKILQLIIWKKTGSKESIIFFSVDFNPIDTIDTIESIDTNGILDIHKFLMKGKQCEIKQSEMYNSNYSY